MITMLSCGYNFIHKDGITIDRPAGAGNYAFVFFKNKAELILDGKLLAAERIPTSCFAQKLRIFTEN